MFNKTPNEWKIWREGFYIGVIVMTVFVVIVAQIAR